MKGEFLMINVLNGKNVAICIMQPSMRLVLPDDTIWEGQSSPISLHSLSEPAETVLGFTARLAPTFTGEADRQLTLGELSADVIFVPMVPEFVSALRGQGFMGQILSPGPIKTASDGKPAAHYSTVTVFSEPKTIMIPVPGSDSDMMMVANPCYRDAQGNAIK